MRDGAGCTNELARGGSPDITDRGSAGCVRAAPWPRHVVNDNRSARNASRRPGSAVRRRRGRRRHERADQTRASRRRISRAWNLRSQSHTGSRTDAVRHPRCRWPRARRGGARIRKDGRAQDVPRSRDVRRGACGGSGCTAHHRPAGGRSRDPASDLGGAGCSHRQHTAEGEALGGRRCSSSLLGDPSPTVSLLRRDGAKTTGRGAESGTCSRTAPRGANDPPLLPGAPRIRASVCATARRGCRAVGSQEMLQGRPQDCVEAVRPPLRRGRQEHSRSPGSAIHPHDMVVGGEPGARCVRVEGIAGIPDGRPDTEFSRRSGCSRAAHITAHGPPTDMKPFNVVRAAEIRRRAPPSSRRRARARAAQANVLEARRRGMLKIGSNGDEHDPVSLHQRTATIGRDRECGRELVRRERGSARERSSRRGSRRWRR